MKPYTKPPLKETYLLIIEVTITIMPVSVQRAEKYVFQIYS